jgi:serum/glucocorticoid-regulated kinase 3
MKLPVIFHDVFQVPSVQLKLPGKKLFGNNLDPQFVQSRREGLNSFIQQIMTDAKFRQL